MRSRGERRAARLPYRGQLSRQLLLQYLASLVIFIVAFVALVAFGWSFCRQFTWYESDPLYRVLHWLREYIPLWSGLIVLSGWCVITYHFIEKPMRYLDEVVIAAGLLAKPDDIPIELPPAMRNVEDQLNLARVGALRSALAAREAIERKNDLIVYLAHDLKTPLTSVIGYLTLLRDEPEISAETRARYTGIALEKAERLEDLINEFFEITRFNLTHLELQTAQVDLTRMLQQVASEFAPLFAEKSLRCTLDLPPELPYACDPDKLARVFDNLLRNACHYATPGSEVRVAARLLPDAAVLTFENEGKTISPDKLSRIFEQFFRLDASRGTHDGGAGLGLAIAKQIVELHGGRITAESADGRVTFTILLMRE